MNTGICRCVSVSLNVHLRTIAVTICVSFTVFLPLSGALHLSLSGFWLSPVCSNHMEQNFSDSAALLDVLTNIHGAKNLLRV